jgi:predicted transcriptional regulator
MKTNNKDALSKLLAKGKMNFQDFINEGCYSNRNSAREHLTSLVKDGLISEDKKNWRRGQSLYFMLTRKGKKVYLDAEAKNMQQSLTVIDTFLNIVEKEGFEDYREEKRSLNPIIKVENEALGIAQNVPLVLDGDFEKRQIKKAFEELNLAFLKFNVVLNTWRVQPFDSGFVATMKKGKDVKA